MRGEGWMIASRSEFRVLNTTPPQPASNDLATISALFETGEDESRNGFLNFIPQKSTDRSMLLATIRPPNPDKPEIRNTKCEIRNTKQILNTNFLMSKINSKLANQTAENLFWSFEFLFFEIVSNLEFRYSDLLPAVNAEFLP